MSVYATVEQAVVSAIFNRTTYDKHVPTLREILLSKELDDNQKAHCLNLLGIYKRSISYEEYEISDFPHPEFNNPWRVRIKGWIIPHIIEEMEKESEKWLQDTKEAISNGKELPWKLKWDLPIYKFNSGTPLKDILKEWESSFNDETTRVL